MRVRLSIVTSMQQDRMSREKTWLEAELARERARATTAESSHEDTKEKVRDAAAWPGK